MHGYLESSATRQPVPSKDASLGRPPGEGGVSICLAICSHSRTCNTYLYMCAGPVCGVGKGTQTPFSLDKLKTQHGSFLFYQKKKKNNNIPFRRKGS